MEELDLDECSVFGCRRDKVNNSFIDILIGEENVRIEPICLTHIEYFQNTAPELYDIGWTYRREVEVRPHPAVPSPPA